MLKPFWCYYGGKWRAAPHYPKPVHPTIIEPFAGAAGYALRYSNRKVILIERYAVVAEMWRFLIAATPLEILSIPLVSSVDDLPDRVTLGARSLVGFMLTAATASPRRTLSAGERSKLETGRTQNGWTEARRGRVASQVEGIRHWKIIEGDYSEAPEMEATWFIDPPYNNKAGSYYVHSSIDYTALSLWCASRLGQVIVCENAGADWLPFVPFRDLKAGINGAGSREVIWQNRLPCGPAQSDLFGNPAS